jgi:fatty-acyl-CoA synthase
MFIRARLKMRYSRIRPCLNAPWSEHQTRKWVEAVTAFVALRPDQTVRESELIAFVASKVASYKKPHRVIFTQDIPKTAVGKLDRKVLRARLRQT